MQIANNPIPDTESGCLDQNALDYGAGFRVKVCLREAASAASLNG